MFDIEATKLSESKFLKMLSNLVPSKINFSPHRIKIIMI